MSSISSEKFSYFQSLGNAYQRSVDESDIEIAVFVEEFHTTCQIGNAEVLHCKSLVDQGVYKFDLDGLAEIRIEKAADLGNHRRRQDKSSFEGVDEIDGLLVPGIVFIGKCV